MAKSTVSKDSSEKQAMCLNHPKEKIQFFCKTEEVNFCTLCVKQH